MKDKFGTGRGRVKNLDEFIDLFRRCQTPYYEEVGQYFDDPEVIEQLAKSAAVGRAYVMTRE